MVAMSRLPRKQRKRHFTKPLHQRAKSMAAHLDEKLSVQFKRRAVTVRVGDTVKIVRGEFKGTKGKLVAGVYGEAPRLIPESAMKAYKTPPRTIPRVESSHEQDWVRACKEGGRACADFEYSGPLTEMCLLGNVARRMDARIEWDAESMKVTNLPEANKYVRTEYRKGWSLY